MLDLAIFINHKHAKIDKNYIIESFTKHSMLKVDILNLQVDKTRCRYIKHNY